MVTGKAVPQGAGNTPRDLATDQRLLRSRIDMAERQPTNVPPAAPQVAHPQAGGQ